MINKIKKMKIVFLSGLVCHAVLYGAHAPAAADGRQRSRVEAATALIAERRALAARAAELDAAKAARAAEEHAALAAVFASRLPRPPSPAAYAARAAEARDGAVAEAEAAREAHAAELAAAREEAEASADFASCAGSLGEASEARLAQTEAELAESRRCIAALSLALSRRDAGAACGGAGSSATNLDDVDTWSAVVAGFARTEGALAEIDRCLAAAPRPPSPPYVSLRARVVSGSGASYVGRPPMPPPSLPAPTNAAAATYHFPPETLRAFGAVLPPPPPPPCVPSCVGAVGGLAATADACWPVTPRAVSLVATPPYSSLSPLSARAKSRCLFPTGLVSAVRQDLANQRVAAREVYSLRAELAESNAILLTVMAERAVATSAAAQAQTRIALLEGQLRSTAVDGASAAAREEDGGATSHHYLSPSPWPAVSSYAESADRAEEEATSGGVAAGSAAAAAVIGQRGRAHSAPANLCQNVTSALRAEEGAEEDDYEGVAAASPALSPVNVAAYAAAVAARDAEAALAAGAAARGEDGGVVTPPSSPAALHAGSADSEEKTTPLVGIAAVSASGRSSLAASAAPVAARLAGDGAVVAVARGTASLVQADAAPDAVVHDAEVRREPVSRFSKIRSLLGVLSAVYVALWSARSPLIDTSAQWVVSGSGSGAGAVTEVPGVLQSSSVSDLYEPTGAGSGGSVPSCIFGDGLAHSAVAQEAMLSNVSSAPVFYGNRENERALDLGFLLRGGPRLPFAVTLAPSEDRSRALVLYSAPTKASDEKAHK